MSPRTCSHPIAQTLFAVLLALSTIAAALVQTPVVAAAGFVVTSTADDGAGSLRQAILDANSSAGADTITFSLPDGATITLESALPDLAGQLTIDGPGADKLTVSGDNAVRVFTVAEGAEVSIKGLTISGGNAYQGGGILNSGTLTLSQSTLSGNTANDGGGIYNRGTLTVSQSTLSGNSANYGGGGIYNWNTLTVSQSTLSGNTINSYGGGIINFGQLTVRNSTITANSADFESTGGGIAQHGTLSLGNTIVAGNFGGAGTVEDNIVGGFVNGGPNLTFGDPNLGPLADNGGPTKTHAPLSGSPAIGGGTTEGVPQDALDMDGDGNTTEPVPFDQRGAGFPRVLGSAPDLGAVEVVVLSISATDATADEAGGTATFTISRDSAGVALAVKLTASGTAGAADYTLSGAGVTGTHPDYTVTIPVGETSVALTLTPANDTPAEADETVALAIVSDAAYTVGNPSSASATIAANDTVVTTTADSGAGSLRQAITNANSFAGADTVSFSLPGAMPWKITLASALPNLAGQLTIAGPGATKLTVSGGGAVRVFYVALDADVTIEGLTISSGRSAYGAGIANYGTLMLSQSTLSGNTAYESYGGGIYNKGTLTVSQSTFSSNSAFWSGGVIFNIGTVTVNQSTLSGNNANLNGAGIINAGGTLTVRNSTITSNFADSDSNGSGTGGGIHVAGGPVSLANTIVAKNFRVGDEVEDNIVGEFTAVGSNLTSGDPKLGPLADNGGPTKTHAPLDGSLALDAGSAEALPQDDLDMDGDEDTTEPVPFDQRGTGFPRVAGSAPDLGAVEVVSLPVVSISATDATADEAGGTATFTISRDTAGVALAVKLTASGTAGAADYTLSGAGVTGTHPNYTVTIPSGETSVALTLTPADDTPAEADETVALAIVSDAAYTVGSPSSASATIAANDTVVTSTADSGEGSLRQAITNANSSAGADTVTFSLSDGATITLASALPNLTGQLTIDGPGAAKLTVSGGNVVRVFAIAKGADVTIKGLTISGGKASEGGGIYNSGTLTLSQSTVSGNTVDWGGAGIFNFGTLTVSQSTISGNSAGQGGGGIVNWNKLTVSQSTISGNTADSSGGIYNRQGLVTVSQSTISGNTATAFVGAIGNEGTLTVSQSTISGNTAELNGGGVISWGTLMVSQSTISGNSAKWNGGGIINYGTLTVTQSTITANRADSDGNGSGTGGGVFVDGGTVSLGNTIVAGNFLGAGTTEDNIFGLLTKIGPNLTSGDPKLGPLADNGGPTKTHAPLDGSLALDAGSAEALPQDTLDMDGDEDTTEPVPFDQRGTGFPRVARGTVDLGAVEAQSTLPSVSISATDATADEAGGTATFTISRDTAGVALAVKLTASGTAGAADYTLSGAGVTGTHPDYTVTIPSGETSVALTLTPADDTPAEADETVALAMVSDAAYTVGSPSSASATIAANDTVVTSTADSGEGSLRQAITNANSSAGADTVTFSLSDGATITLASALPNLTGQFTIDGPGAAKLTVSGGNAVGVFSVAEGAEATIKGLTISGGSAGEGGGGILNIGTLTVSQSTISGNTATYEGGGIYNQGTMTVSQSTISGNQGYYGGGGIANYGTLTVSQSTISGNTATYEGGGIYNQGTMTVSQSTISGNSADFVGGIANYGTLMVHESIINGNTATYYVGGIYNDDTLTVNKSTISGNTATVYDGGGIYNRSTLSLYQSTISGNSAKYGGGIINFGTMMLSQSTISGNSAEYGGGIFNTVPSKGGVAKTASQGAARDHSIWSHSDGFLNAGTVIVRNSTITANRADSDGNDSGTGGGVFIDGGTVSLGNTIVAGNVVGTGTTADNINGEFTAVGPNLTSGDPKLGPLADNGGPTKTHAPLSGSPALDGGSADAVPQDDLDMDGDTNITEPVPFDQRGTGFPRVARGTVDIGAVEAQVIGVTIGKPSVSTTASGPVSYVVTFAGATGYTFHAGKVTLHKTGTATGSVAVSGSGPQFTVTISAISGEGTLGISVAAGAAHDDDGNLAPEAGPSATFTVHQEQNDPRPYKAFLPVMQRLPNQPDLVVEAIGTDEGRLTVTIANIGGAATGEGFWVDLAIAPRRAPARVNDTWASVGSRGMAWGVARSLAPGERLTLTVGDAYYAAEHSSPGGPIAAGTALYAHVDSASTTNTYGGVRESHEVTGEAYNNVLGPVAATTEVAVTALDVAPAASPAGARLPARR